MAFKHCSGQHFVSVRNFVVIAFLSFVIKTVKPLIAGLGQHSYHVGSSREAKECLGLLLMHLDQKLTA
jgi:hypothetical protein